MDSHRRPRFVAIVALCCIVCLLALPAVTVAQQSTPRARNAADSNGQPVSTCFSGSGSAFTVGSEDGAHIWVRLHAAMLTGSGGSIGAELTGAIGDAPIVEVVAGLTYVGDGVLGLFTSPVDSFDLVSGFDIQLPMLENATTGAGDGEPTRADGNRSITGSGATDASSGETASDDTPFELLEC